MAQHAELVAIERARLGPQLGGGMESQADRVVAFVTQFPGKDDDEISRLMDIHPRQTVNQICRSLASAGRIARRPGSSGKLANFPSARGRGRQCDAHCSSRGGVRLAAHERKGVDGLIENGVSCDIVTGGLGELVGAADPRNEAFALTRAKTRSVVGLIGLRKAVDLGIVPASSMAGGGGRA
jgi:hypothetical protein